MAADGVEAVTSGMDAEVHLIFDPGEDAHIFNVDDIRRQILTGYLATTLLNPSLPNIEWDDSLIISGMQPEPLQLPGNLEIVMNQNKVKLFSKFRTDLIK
ncbi:unnamed protein product [Schistocephalus solidus]|uniref:FAA_hydrolase domain-containing protein n=1 Tax=Schistocephalus solidus TaxID=70667 RepID=A0A183TSB2_SCHSO|nr:unnamed protein product [Schistocephalus solidus]